MQQVCYHPMARVHRHMQGTTMRACIPAIMFTAGWLTGSASTKGLGHGPISSGCTLAIGTPKLANQPFQPLFSNNA